MSLLPIFRSRVTVRAAAPLLSLCLGLFVSTALADSPSITTIEEDWEVVIGTPDTNSTSPQIRAVMSPSGDIDTTHVAFTLNHHTQPNFVSGGMQLQVWYGDEAQLSHASPSTELLRHENETIRWTQRMTISGSTVTFEIVDGSSTTWGAFGGQGYLKLSVASDKSDLNSYKPAVSTANSEVGFAANRVDAFGLKQVRAYTSEGLLWTIDGEGNPVE